jgi:serine-type D-Ala-D-Ala carboxypeptidase (penicillin-binding protein 5/6)
MRIALIFFILTFSFSAFAKPLKVNVSAQSALLINADSGAILYEKKPHLPCHPASIVKIATALYALEKKQPFLDEKIKVSRDAIGTVTPQVKRANRHPDYRLTTDGTMMGLRAGEIISLRTLMYGMMLPSGNDAANVIAEYVGGTVPQFLEQLNGYLKEKGCIETHFFNPSGLPHSQQLTTAHDMALITQLALRNPFFREVVKANKYPRFETDKDKSSIVQYNRLLRQGPFFYPKAIGVKTGSTDAGQNLVAAAKDGDRTLIAVLLYCADAGQRFKDAIALFEAAFAEKEVTRILLTQEYDHFTVSVKGAKGSLEASLAEDLKIAYFPSEEPELKALLHWNALILPIKKGQLVGEVRLANRKNEIVQRAPLFAMRDVNMTGLQLVKVFLKEEKKWLFLLLGLVLFPVGFLFAKKRL